MDGAPGKVVIAFVARQVEVIQVWLRSSCMPIVIAEAGEEAVFFCTFSVAAQIGGDELMIELADVFIDRLSRTIRVVVIPGGDDQVGLPAPDQGSHIPLHSIAAAVIANHRKTQRLGARGAGWRLCGG